ncbi:hypothetical protein BGW37DRAFT_555534 [Umbelopsis sp. PMI_123]|nr:hypothetical protein BGW37DRAFT_555534 [Umbelopsis sp. PMI_123]
MSIKQANAFWAAQESSYDNSDLFLPADTPTTAMTIAMVNKRKNTLANRHKRQLQRLCDFQTKELQDHRREFCTLHKHQISQLYENVQPRSEIGMFEEIAGSVWLQHNQHKIFQTTMTHGDSAEDADNENILEEGQSDTFTDLVDKLNTEQNDMRIKQLSEYENYRVFQLRELQMLNFDITARNNNQTHPTSTPDIMPASTPDKSIVPITPSTVDMQKTEINVTVADLAIPRLNINKYQAPLTASPTTPHVSASSNQPRSNDTSSNRKMVPPPPPPPPPPMRSRENTGPNDQEKQNQKHHSQSRGQRYSSESSSRSSFIAVKQTPKSSHRSSGQPSYSSSSRKEKREGSPRSSYSSGKKRDRPRSSPNGSERENNDRKRRDARFHPVRFSEQRSPPRSAPSTSQSTKQQRKSQSRPTPTSIQLPQSSDDNLPPTVASSSISNKGKVVVPAAKNQNQSSVVVETNEGTVAVVRRYMGGKKPKEYLGDPGEFDDALYNIKKAGNIMQVRAYWQGESALCFMNRRKKTILGRVAEIEPVIREYFVRSSSNADL